MEISEKIKELRKTKGLSQAALGKLIGTSQSAINYFENKGNELTISQIERIAEALGVSAKELLFGESEGVIMPNNKEIEDLHREIEKYQQKIENLTLQVDNENLLRTSREDKINRLCWEYIKEYAKSVVPHFYNYTENNKELLKIKNEILSDTKFANIIEECKDLLDIQRQWELSSENLGLFRCNITVKSAYGKRIFKEYQKMIKKPLENISFFQVLISDIEANSDEGFEEHFLGFNVMNHIVTDMSLLEIMDIYIFGDGLTDEEREAEQQRINESIKATTRRIAESKKNTTEPIKDA